MDRREFLKTSGALVVSFSLPPIEAIAQSAGKPALVPNELDSWIAVLPDGRVNAFFGKMDMGQGLDVAVAQIVAEELDVGFDKVSVLMGDTASSCNQGGASGSTGTSNGARLLRKAAAEARRVLVERAADRLGAPAAELRVEDGTVVSPRGCARTARPSWETPSRRSANRPSAHAPRARRPILSVRRRRRSPCRG